MALLRCLSCLWLCVALSLPAGAGLLPMAASAGTGLLPVAARGLPARRLLLLWSAGSRCPGLRRRGTASAAQQHAGSSQTRIEPMSPALTGDSPSLGHQESPCCSFMRRLLSLFFLLLPPPSFCFTRVIPSPLSL